MKKNCVEGYVDVRVVFCLGISSVLFPREKGYSSSLGSRGCGESSGGLTWLQECTRTKTKRKKE